MSFFCTFLDLALFFFGDFYFCLWCLFFLFFMTSLFLDDVLLLSPLCEELDELDELDMSREDLLTSVLLC